MKDEMFFSEDSKSLRRGKRVAARTPTCRPCIVWPKDAPELKQNGVILNLNPYGMLIRMMDEFALQTEVVVQMMRDDQFREPLSRPVGGQVVRHASGMSGFVDHGVRLVREAIERNVSRPVNLPQRRPMRYTRPRMHTIDVTVGGTPRERRTGRNRG
jgi:hypothetical protein